MSGRQDEAPLPAAFYARPCAAVARALLGARLVSVIDGARVEARVVETEAYTGPDDPASHAAERIGRTARNRSMFGPPGIAYVYRIYGIHWCLNIVTDEPGHPAAVLIRAAEPVHGLETMRARRWRATTPGTDRNLLRGPARLAQAFAIDRALDGHPLDRPPLFVLPDRPVPDNQIAATPRIGVTRAADAPLRFLIVANAFVSR